jgi:hypothetical protein
VHHNAAAGDTLAPKVEDNLLLIHVRCRVAARREWARVSELTSGAKKQTAEWAVSLFLDYIQSSDPWNGRMLCSRSEEGKEVDGVTVRTLSSGAYHASSLPCAAGHFESGVLGLQYHGLQGMFRLSGMDLLKQV